MIGKNFAGFSNDWKIFFQWLENRAAAAKWRLTVEGGDGYSASKTSVWMSV